MGLKTIGKSETGSLEKAVRIEMIKADITQAEIADHLDLTIGAINNRLKRLTNDKAKNFINLIDEVAAKKDEKKLSKAAC